MMQTISKREQEITDPAQICRILDTAKILHLGMVNGDEPYVLPMNYGYTLEDGQLTLYLHAAVQGRKLDLLRANPKVFFTLECDIVPFVGERPCQYGITYAAVAGKGIAEIVEDVDQKMDAMTILMRTQTGKEFSFTEKLVSIVSVIRIRATNFSAKHRPLPERLQMLQDQETK